MPILSGFNNWLEVQRNVVQPKSALGTAIQYALNNWEALCRFTEEGYLEPDNNDAERCLRPVAVGTKAFPTAGSERGGRAAAIYFFIVESCKVSQVNPLTHLNYVLEHLRDKSHTLQTADEFSGSNITQVG